MYDTDKQDNFPVFLITEVKSDSKFLSSFNALLEAGFDINESNADDTTFI